MNATEIEAALEASSAQVERRVGLSFLTTEWLIVVFTPSRIRWPQVVRAVASLGDLPVSFRATLEQRVYRFYLQEIEDGSADFKTAQDQLNWEAEATKNFKQPKAAEASAEVWPLVRFERVVVHPNKSGDEVIVRVEGLAAWDGEHGIVLHFAGGQRLIDVTGYGHFL